MVVVQVPPTAYTDLRGNQSMTWFTEFLLRADASRRGRRASIRRSPGDTVQYNINGQLMNVVIPANL